MEASRVAVGVDKLQLAEDKIDKIEQIDKIDKIEQIDKIDKIEHSNEVSDEDKERLRGRKTLRQNSIKGLCREDCNQITKLTRLSCFNIKTK